MSALQKLFICSVIALCSITLTGCRSSRMSGGERLWEAMEVIPPEEMPEDVKDAGFEVISNDDISIANITTSVGNAVPDKSDMCLVKAEDTNSLAVISEGITETTADVKANNLIFDEDFKPVLGTYFYKVSWRGIGVGDAAVKIGKENGMHTLEIRAGTGRKLDYLYKVRYRGKSKMTIAPEVASVVAEIDAKVQDRERNTKLDFKDDGNVEFKLTKKKKGRVRSIKDMEIKTTGFVLDPFSAACLVRRLEWKVGTEAIFDVITGNTVYELRLRCTKIKTIKVKKKKRRAWVVVPYIRELEAAGEKINKEHEDNINKSLVEIYVAMDGSKDILRIEGHHKVGTIKAEIDKFKPGI